MADLDKALEEEITRQEELEMVLASESGDLRNRDVEAFARGLGNTASFGLQDELIAGAKTVAGVSFGGTPLTLEGISEEFMENLETTSQYEDDLAEQNPGADIVGGILGAVTGAFGLAKAGVKTLLSTGPKATKFVSAMRSSPITRIAATATVGSIEGGAYATFEGLPVLENMGTGALWGAGGQALLGELLPGAVRYLKGDLSPQSKHKAKTALFNRLKEEHDEYGDDPAALDALWDMYSDKLARLGPKATLADLSDLVYADMSGVLKDPRLVNRGASFAKVMKHRINEGDEFSNRTLDRTLGPSPTRSATEVANQARSTAKIYQAEMSEALKNSTNTVDSGYLQHIVDDSFIIEGMISPDAMKVRDRLISHIKQVSVLRNGKPAYTKAGKLVKGATELDIEPFNMQAVKDFEHILDRQFKANVADTNAVSVVLDTALNKHLGILRKTVVGQLDKGVANHATLRGRYADLHKITNAHDLGVDILKLGRDTDVTALQSAIESFEIPEQDALLDGAKWAIENKLMTATDEGATLIKRLGMAGDLRAKLIEVFSAPVATKLVDGATAAARLRKVQESAVKFELTGKSTKHEANIAARVSDIGIAGASAAGMLGQNIGVGAGRRQAMQLAGTSGKSLDKAYSNLVANQGPEAQTLLKDLRGQGEALAPTDPYDTLAKPLGLLGVIGNNRE
jgi:hypothetical protein